MNQPVIQAVGDTLTLIAGVMLSPIPLAGLIAVLTSYGGRTKSIAFGAGFFSALWLATFGLALLGRHAENNFQGSGGSSAWNIVIHAGLGGFLLFFSLFVLLKWFRNRSRASAPKWMEKIDSASSMTIFGMAATMVLVNAKNLPIVISAATEYAHSGLSTAQIGLVVTIFATLGSLLAIAPIVFELVAPKTATRVLEEMRPWLIANNGLILSVMFFLMGFHMLERAVQ